MTIMPTRRKMKKKCAVILGLVITFFLFNLDINKIQQSYAGETNCTGGDSIFTANCLTSRLKIGNSSMTAVRGDNRVLKITGITIAQHGGSQDHVTTKTSTTFKLDDDQVNNMIEKLMALKNKTFFPRDFFQTSFHDMVANLGTKARKSAKLLPYFKHYVSQEGSMPPWMKLHANIRQYSLYDPDDPNIDIVMREMATFPIISAVEAPGGTQFKLIVKFSNDGHALLKPMRYKREVEANENHYIFDDMERHVAEIAAFQLDKLLGFYRVPPTVGRRLNIKKELRPLLPADVAKTVFTSPAGNLCFYGTCRYYCDHAHAFCGSPDDIEVSLQTFLPPEDVAKRKSHNQPWRRSYSRFRKAYWEKNDDMCQRVRTQAPYNNGKLLLDLIDVHTFDFLMGNKDRHNTAVFHDFGFYSFPILYDNGRGFGRQTYDAMSILAPLKQCCLIRKSTLLKYIKLYTGPDRLSSLMEKALESDPVAPVLIRGHLNALDRRLVKLLQAVVTCLENNPHEKVIISDRF